MNKLLPRALATLLSWSCIEHANAVPIGFLQQESGTQSDVNWIRHESKRFSVYTDEKAASLGKYALNSLEYSWPELSLLLGIKLNSETPQALFPSNYVTSRFDRIPVVISTRAETGGFADPITQKLELQIQTGSQSQLFQHELTHRLMYEHFDLGVGPGGRAFTLAMVPAWWMEGLPEYLTQSIGRLSTLGVERMMALHNGWLTWDRLHSLYNAQGDIMTRGYVSSGRLFKYLIEKERFTDLPALMNDFFWKTITPPFIDAENRFLKKNWKKSGPDLYKEYKAESKRFWETYLQGVPSLNLLEGSRTLYSSTWTFPYVLLDNGQIIRSHLTSETPYTSSFTVTNSKNKVVRLPLSRPGSAVFDVHPYEAANGGGIWTSRIEKFKNGTTGEQLVFLEFQGPLSGIADKRILREQKVVISSESAPFIVHQIVSFGGGRAFVVASKLGQMHLLAVATSGTFVVLKRWESPAEVKLLPPQRSQKEISKSSCIAAIVDLDLERTSIERLCSNATVTQLLPTEKLFIKDGFERADGSFVLLGGWRDLVGIFELQKGGVLIPVAPVQEYLETLRPAGTSLDEVVAYHYTGNNSGSPRSLTRFSLSKLKVRFAQLEPDSIWHKTPVWEPYAPPFVELAAQRRDALTREQRIEEKTEGGTTVTNQKETNNLDASVSAENRTEKQAIYDFTERHRIPVTKESADYRHSHLMSYPYPGLPYFNGLGIGLVSVPWRDEMDRDRLEIYGFYHLTNSSLSGTVTWLSSRILDGFSLSAFTRERFNGMYGVCSYQERLVYCSDDLANKKTIDKAASTDLRDVYVPYPNSAKYFSYLWEKGISAAIDYKLRPTSIAFNLHGSYFKTEPEPLMLRNWILGPQTAKVLSLGLGASSTLFDLAFYLGKPAEYGAGYLTWKTSAGASNDWHQSLGTVSSGDGYTHSSLTGNPYTINYNRSAGSLTSALGWGSQTLSLRGSAALTSGKGTFNLRETYQPYRTYLQGAGQGLNALNYGILGDGKLFAYNQGAWQYRTSIDYSFPLLTGLDKQIFITYLDNISGEIVLSRGGVTNNTSPVGFQSFNSASLAARATFDIKGFQIFPSLAYGKMLGSPGWALFTEVAFSQFF